MDIKIRQASADDAEELLEIYAPYVRDTAVSFEYEVPPAEEFRRRIENTMEMYPYLAAETGGVIAGYAYAGAFKERSAYDRAVETTVYVRRDMRRMGVGSRLYGKLEECLKAQGILNLNACIAYTDAEDKYLTGDSVRFHEKAGFQMAGHFHKCGYKFGRWYDMVWMEKLIGEHGPNPRLISPFAGIK